MAGKFVVLVIAVIGVVAGLADEDFDEEVPSDHMPQLLSDPLILEATAGETVTFPCAVDELGLFVKLWKKGKSQVLFASHMRVFRDNRIQLVDDSLMITSVQPKDGGEYICQISTNPPLEVSHTLKVLYPPTIKPDPQDGLVTVKEGDSVTLSCDATGNPTPTISWKHAGRNYDISDDSRFTITHALKSASGEYECIADNGIGKPASAVLTVEVVSAPKVTPHPLDGVLVVNEGELIEMSCEASGDPLPVIVWKTPNTDRPHKSRDGDRIVISKAERNHTGVYECIANNSLGVHTSAHIRVQVLYPPEIRVQNSWVHAGEGTNVEISCNVKGEPVPSVTWKRVDNKGESKDIHSNEHYHLKTSGHHHILQIRHVRKEDFVRYDCVASNSLKHVAESIHITGTPQLPLFTSKPHGSHPRTYTLAWTVKSHSPVDEYSLIYRRKSDSEEWATITIPAEKETGLQSLSYELNNLHPGTSYEARVTAKNKYGWSKQSDAFIFSTKREAELTQETVPSVSTVTSEPMNSNEKRFQANSSSCLRQPGLLFLLQSSFIFIFCFFH